MIPWATPRSLAGLLVLVLILAVAFVVYDASEGPPRVIALMVSICGALWFMFHLWKMTRKTVIRRVGNMVVIESNQIRFETMSFKENEFMMEVKETAKFDTENVGIRRSGWAFAVSVQQEGRAFFITPNYPNFKIALNTKAQIEQALRDP